MELADLRHIVRLRTTDDREYMVRQALDAVMVNANELENHAEASSSTLVDRGIPYLVDPMLWRFQVLDWWHRPDGRVKRNFQRLALRYSAGTDVVLARGPLLTEVRRPEAWSVIAHNCIRYQLDRIPEASGSLLRAMHGDADPRPIALTAPYLLAESGLEDDINRRLLEESAAAAGSRVIGSVALPLARALVDHELERALAVITEDVAIGASVWLEGLTEERLVMGAGGDALIRIAETLASRGLPVWNAHGGFATLCLRRHGITGIVHPLAWRDGGAPARPPRGIPQPSRTSYVTSLHQTERFDAILRMAANLTPETYLEHWCSCWFCRQAIQANHWPLELMLQETERTGPRGRDIRVPAEEALSFNRWHFLWARHLESEQLQTLPVQDVIRRAILDANWLHHDSGFLQSLAAAV